MASSDDSDNPTGLGYADALAELETILDDLEDDNIDIDVLGGQGRAGQLAHPAVP